MRKINFLLSIISMLTLGQTNYAQQKAFPGAEGYGAYATGGRGGAVYEVTNLNDGGAGSLRAAVQASGTRTVVFRVSGTIELNSNLTIFSPNITIAGQTAPGDGICIKNYPLVIDADNVIVRFIRSRLGDEKETEADAMSGRNQKNIIIDHCSMSWSVDETASFYDNENFTMQWCIISESLYKSVHGKGNHGYGGIWGGKGATFHHNMLAHHTSRNPRFCGSRYSNKPDLEKIDHRNNVIYNWGGNSCYGAEGGTYNIVNNYYKYGPATSSKNRIINPDADGGGNSQPAGVMGEFYIHGNYVWGYDEITEDNWMGGVHGVSSSTIDEIRLLSPLNSEEVTTHAAEEAFAHVLARGGAILPKRDAVDARVLEEARTGTATYGASYGAERGIIDTPSDVGGWPDLNSTEAPVDTDKDGMPDDWEDANGLDKNDAADRNNIGDNGYTQLEIYLNSLVDSFDYILRPIQVQIDTIIDMDVNISWQDIADNETGYVLERKSGDGNWSELATLSANETSYTDESITEYNTYSYRLKAINESIASFYSDEIEAEIKEETEPVGLDHSLGDIEKIEVFPNPFKSAFNLNLTVKKATSIEVTLYSVAGKQIEKIQSYLIQPGEHIYQIDGSRMNKGLYFINVKTNNHNEVLKLVRD